MIEHDNLVYKPFHDHIKQAAFEYWKQGLYVVPFKWVTNDNETPKVQPLVEWGLWEQKRQTLEEFQKLPWQEAEGFALVCGDKTNNNLYLGVLDFDKHNTTTEAQQAGKKVLSHVLITRIEATRRGGEHWVYYSQQQPKTIDSYRDQSALELLGKGHLVVMAPSIGYRRLNDNLPTVVQDLEIMFLNALNRAGIKENIQEDIQKAPTTPYKGPDPACVRAMLRGVEQGNRDNYAIRLACYWMNMRGYDNATTLGLLREWNKKNRPPLEDKVLVEKVKSAQKGGYVFGCSDSILASLCMNKSSCPLKAKQQEAEKPVSIPHINHVEDPTLAGKLLTVEAVVASSSIAYLVPKEVEATVQKGEDNFEVLEATLKPDDPFNIKLVGVNEDVKWRRLRRLFGEPTHVRVKEKAWRTIYLIKVRPPVFTLEKRGDKIVDERGFEYKSFDVYVCAEQTLTFQPSALVRLEAKPLGSPKTQKTVLLASQVGFPEETLIFDRSKLKKLKATLDSYTTVKEKILWILSEFEKFSGLVARRNLALAGFLTFFSPLWVTLDRETQRGWAVTLMMGDTTTGKSETVRKLIMLLKGGMLITAETASQVGLTGTAIQLEKEGWFTDWGFLVLCDRGLLAIDGVHKLPISCWAALAEAERSGVVTIAKAAKNSAYARTRQIKIANPVDNETERWKTKTLADFLYPCQSLPTVLDKTGIARLDLVVFADTRDVKAEQVNFQMDKAPNPDLELLSEALKWCWSGTAKVEFTPQAVQTVLTLATELYNTFYTPAIPLVSMDTKWKIARLSIALAYLTLSTDDFSKVKVTEEHVKEVVEFIREEYGKAGLNTMAQEEHFEAYTSEDVERITQAIATQADLERDTLENIFKFIVLNGRVTRDQLKAEFSIPEHPQLRALLASLQNSKLIRAGRGFYPTPQLIQLYKVLSTSRLSRLSRPEKDPQQNSGSQGEGTGG